MRIAHIELYDGSAVYAVQQTDGRLARAEGNPMTGGLVATREMVEPKRWLPPIEPRAILCIGRNYAEHAAEGGAPPPEFPILFMKNPNAAIGHEAPIRLPRVCGDEVDYEGELVVVLKKAALNVPRNAALSYVLGYTIGHDVSARVWQQHKGGSQWCRGKSFDTFAPMGPVLVTADEIPDPSGLSIRTTVNGREVQKSTTDKMIFDVPALISFLSQDTTLLPGTVIMTGTPEGVGWARAPKLTLRPGDRVSVEIGRIGCLSNPVMAA
ncbi:MAG TPA: fumarylacetoacetate hydrolase family protein [Candidatus Hydrogenedentes bacterium]|nr:fumarylacetoacetate hydrolase family protein [Candidatus Hydrogenedentota bacterium]